MASGEELFREKWHNFTIYLEEIGVEIPGLWKDPEPYLIAALCKRWAPLVESKDWNEIPFVAAGDIEKIRTSQDPEKLWRYLEFFCVLFSSQ